MQATSTKKVGENTPRTRGGPGGRDRTVAVKRKKKRPKISFCKKENLNCQTLVKLGVAKSSKRKEKRSRTNKNFDCET